MPGFAYGSLIIGHVCDRCFLSYVFYWGHKNVFIGQHFCLDVFPPLISILKFPGYVSRFLTGQVAAGLEDFLGQRYWQCMGHLERFSLAVTIYQYEGVQPISPAKCVPFCLLVNTASVCIWIVPFSQRAVVFLSSAALCVRSPLSWASYYRMHGAGVKGQLLCLWG